MTLAALICVYALVGVGFAVLELARNRPRTWSSAGSVAAALLVWPLWAPFADVPGARCSRSTASQPQPACARVEAALACARSRVVGTELDGIVSEADVAAICVQVRVIAARVDSLDGELKRLQKSQSSSPRHDSCTQRVLLALERDRQALDELGDLADALATELTLAQCGHTESVEGLIVELSARIEALTVA